MIQHNKDTFFCGVQGGRPIGRSHDFLSRRKAYQPITWLPEQEEDLSANRVASRAGGRPIGLSCGFQSRRKTYRPIMWLPEQGEHTVGAASPLLLGGGVLRRRGSQSASLATTFTAAAGHHQIYCSITGWPGKQRY